MQRWRGLEHVPGDWARCVATIGVFDGVHRGHRRTIGRTVELARAAGHAAVVVTFDPHPSEVVRPGTHPALLSAPAVKADLVADCGVDVLVVLPFTVELSRLSPAAFVYESLVERLHVATVVVGENFRFGAQAAGDVTVLSQLGRTFGFTVEPMPLLVDDGTTLSSTAIRALVAAGDVAAAARALQRLHRIDGVVVRGDARGRELGYPTANVEPGPRAAIPADGVYAGYLVRGAQRLPAAISIGTNPTFAGTERRVEAFVLDFAGDLYGEHVAVEFQRRLRRTETFDSVDALVAQMARDVAETRVALDAAEPPAR